VKVLLVSTDIDLSVALQILLREEPDCVVAGSIRKIDIALAMIQTDCPDLVVLDWDSYGQKACEMLVKAKSSTCFPYVIAIGKYEGDERIAADTGADAFVVKGTSPENLISAIHIIYHATQTSLPHQMEKNQK
jgi:DNA-binding response OmpR family regulator